MKLFQWKKKPIFEEVTRDLEKEISYREESYKQATTAATALLDDSNEESYFFENTRARTFGDMRLWANKILETNDGNEARFDLTQYSQAVSQAWTLILVEGLNRRMTHQRELTFRLLDAIAQNHQDEILRLRDELRTELESKTPSKEDMEKVKIFVKHFDAEVAKATRDAEEALKSETPNITRDATQEENHP